MGGCCSSEEEDSSSVVDKVTLISSQDPTKSAVEYSNGIESKHVNSFIFVSFPLNVFPIVSRVMR